MEFSPIEKPVFIALIESNPFPENRIAGNDGVPVVADQSSCEKSCPVALIHHREVDGMLDYFNQ